MINANFLPDNSAEILPSEECTSPTPSDIVAFLNNIKQQNRLPLNNVEVYYHDNIWDFWGLTTANLAKSTFRLDFQKCPVEFRDILKDYVLICILEGRNKVNHIQKNEKVVAEFFKYAVEHGYFEINSIPPSLISEWLTTFNNLKETTIEGYSSSLRNFLITYNSNISDIFSNEHLKSCDVVPRDLLTAIKQNSKTPNIPEEFFQNTLSASIKTMNDTNAPALYRGLACILVIVSETGLRTGELFALEVGCLKQVTIFNGETAYYMEYKTWKHEKGTGTISISVTYVNDLTKRAYDVLESLYCDKRKKWGLPYLFLDKLGPQEKRNFPITPSEVPDLMKHVFFYFNKYFTTVLDSPSNDPALPTVKYFYYGEESHRRKSCYVIKPSLLQFRVHMCSSLYEKGVPLEYVERFMAHLSSEMRYYYIRPKNTPQEDLASSTHILKGIVTGELTPLGSEKGLVGKIEEFIHENNYNIDTDLETICDKLAQHIPIRLKTGGVCIKSSRFRECSKDAITNEFFCAYGVCPNIYTFYYMIDISFRQAHELEKAIQLNIKYGHMKQAQKDSNMLKTVVSKKVIPQLNDLKEKVELYGIDTIVNKYPQVSYYITHLEEVEKEVFKWQQMTQ